MRVKHLTDFKRLKRKYSGFPVNVELKKGNGGDVSGVIAPVEMELELMSYLGLKGDGNFLFIIKSDNSCSYLSATIINRIDVDTSRKCVIY